MTSNKIISKIILAATLCFCSIYSYAQDPTYSQYAGNEMNFNPAYTGSARDLRFSGTYRTLWPNVPGKGFPGPLSSYNANADIMLKIKLGVGLSAGQDVEGQGYLSTTSFAVPLSYHLVFNRSEFNSSSLYIGVRPSMNQIKIDWSRFVFSDQLDPQYGIVQNSSFSQGQMNSHYYFNLDVGLMARFAQKLGRFENYEEVGFAISNVVSPAISVIGSKDQATRLQRRYVAHARAAFKTVDKLFIGPLTVFENQAKFYAFKLGVDFYYRPRLNPDIVPVIFGIYHRTGFANGSDTRSFIAFLGTKGILKGGHIKDRTATYNVGLSADFNYGGLNMQTFGAYELTVGFTIPTRLSLDYNEQDCFWR